eukprot:5560683-Amphidinium_carterae.1
MATYKGINKKCVLNNPARESIRRSVNLPSQACVVKGVVRQRKRPMTPNFKPSDASPHWCKQVSSAELPL